MRKLMITTLLIALASRIAAQELIPKLIPYRKGDKWGYSDTAKNMVIKPRFSEAGFFFDPLAVAKEDSLYCVINENGDIVYKSKNHAFIVDDGRNFITWADPYTYQMFDSKGNPVTKVYHRINGFNKYGYAQVTAGYVKQGLIDRSYQEVVPPKYGSIEFFSKDLVKVYDESTKKYGLFNLKTRRQFATEYSMIYPPREGLMMVRQGDLYGFIDMTGKVVIPVKYQKEIPHEEKKGVHYNEYTYEQFNFDGFYSGLAVVVDQDQAGYIDKKGKTVIPFMFDKAYGFHGNYAWVQKNNKWGIINRQGQYVVRPEYKLPAVQYAKELTALDGFHEGLVAVTKDSLYGYVDTTGEVVIPFKYTRANPFYDGLAAVYIGDKVAFINRQGETVIPPKYNWVEGVGMANTKPFYNDYGIALHADNSWSLIDKKGNELLPMKFTDDHISFEHGLATGKANGKRYVFNEKGEILHTFDNDRSVYPYTRDLFYSYDDKCYFNIRSKVRYCE